MRNVVDPNAECDYHDRLTLSIVSIGLLLVKESVYLLYYM